MARDECSSQSGIHAMTTTSSYGFVLWAVPRFHRPERAPAPLTPERARPACDAADDQDHLQPCGKPFKAKQFTREEPVRLV